VAKARDTSLEKKKPPSPPIPGDIFILPLHFHRLREHSLSQREHHPLGLPNDCDIASGNPVKALREPPHPAP
jgi:hypothetical protein